MKLLVGLGNPGEKYKNNRHNVGYMFIDYIITQLRITNYGLKFQEKFNSQFAKYVINNNELFLAKPLAFMNLSGTAVKKLSTDYQLQPNDLIIVHDDLDIPLGKFKIQKGVGPQLHNGIESIEKALETKDFWRVRIGVDNRTANNWIDGETYVLQNFLPEEKKIIWPLFPEIVNRLKNELLVKLSFDKVEIT